MEIVIDDYESSSPAPNWTYTELVSRYWGAEYGPGKYFPIEVPQLVKAINYGYDDVEITIKNIVANAALSHRFRKRQHNWQGRYIIQERDGRITAERATTNLMQLVNTFGPQTVFKFRIPTYKLLKVMFMKATVGIDSELQCSFGTSRLSYTLGKEEDGTICFLLLGGLPYGIPSGTVSGGVKIPGGAEAE